MNSDYEKLLGEKFAELMNTGDSHGARQIMEHLRQIHTDKQGKARQAGLGSGLAQTAMPRGHTGTRGHTLEEMMAMRMR